MKVRGRAIKKQGMDCSYLAERLLNQFNTQLRSPSDRVRVQL